MSVSQAYVRFVESTMVLCDLAEAIRNADALGVEARIEILDHINECLGGCLEQEIAPKLQDDEISRILAGV